MRKGGQNKEAGRIEAAWRIDSFETANESIFCGNDSGGVMLDQYITAIYLPGEEQERETVALYTLDGSEIARLPLTRTRCGCGGLRPFWMCPRCRRRVRYLYVSDRQSDRGFCCRYCARLNYSSQQATKDAFYYYTAGLSYARDYLHYAAPDALSIRAFWYIRPTRPAGMHKKTYDRHLAKLARLQALCRNAYYAELNALLPDIAR